MASILMADRLPEQLEICARDLAGRPCGGVLYRPQPDVVYCQKCGGREPGLIYVKADREATPSPIGDTSLVTMLRHLTARRWRLLGWRFALDLEWRARPRPGVASPTGAEEPRPSPWSSTSWWGRPRTRPTVDATQPTVEERSDE
jgi:hypothetical protein